MSEGRMNGLAIAREIADELDLAIDDGFLGWLMWNETGWPSFFDGDPETTYRQQLRIALAGVTEDTERCSLENPHDGPPPNGGGRHWLRATTEDE